MGGLGVGDVLCDDVEVGFLCGECVGGDVDGGNDVYENVG